MYRGLKLSVSLSRFAGGCKAETLGSSGLAGLFVGDLNRDRVRVSTLLSVVEAAKASSLDDNFASHRVSS